MPHLNGKVERVQKTVLDEFYVTANIEDPELESNLLEWQYHYNHERIHGSLNMPPFVKMKQLYDDGKLPGWEKVDDRFDAVKEYIRLRSLGIDIGHSG